MTDYTINDLRGDLAATIKALREGDPKMDVAKAKAIGDLAQTMINSAKVEVDMLRTVGRGRMKPTGFVALSNEGDTLDGQEGARDNPALPAPQDHEGRRNKPHIRNPMGSAPHGGRW
jgi:hypothetical protein